MVDVATALDAAAARHQRESDRLSTALEFILMDLMMRIGQDQNVTEWVGLGTQRLEAGATSYANLSNRYLETQLAILSPSPPPLPEPDLSWVRSDIDKWLPSSMVEVIGKTNGGMPIEEALTEIGPQIQRQVSAFVNEVEARTVNEALSRTDDFWTFDMNRPSAAQLRDLGIPTAPNGINVEAGITELERYANSFEEAGYPISKSKGGGALKIMIEPQIGACGFCVIRADRLYTTKVLHGDRIRSHAYCRCGWRTVSSTEAQTFESVLGDGAWRQVADRRAVPDPNVPAQGDLTP